MITIIKPRPPTKDYTKNYNGSYSYDYTSNTLMCGWYRNYVPNDEYWAYAKLYIPGNIKTVRAARLIWYYYSFGASKGITQLNYSVTFGALAVGSYNFGFLTGNESEVFDFSEAQIATYISPGEKTVAFTNNTDPGSGKYLLMRLKAIEGYPASPVTLKLTTDDNKTVFARFRKGVSRR